MNREHSESMRAEIAGIKTVLYSLCAVLGPEQSKHFQDLLQRQINGIQAALPGPAGADGFVEKVVAVIEDFRLLDNAK